MDAAVPAPAVSSATTTATSAQDVGTPLTEAVGAAAATPSTAVTTPLSVGEAAMAEAAAALPSHAATRPNVSGFAVSMQQAAERAVSSARRAVERRESASQHGQLSASTVEAEDGDVQGRTAVFVMRDFVPDSTNHIRVQLCQEREGDWCLFVETRAHEQNITTVFRLPHTTGESLRLQLRRRGFGDVRTATQETVVANEEERQAIFVAMRMTPETSIAAVDGLLQPAELQPRQLQFMNGQSNTQAAGAGEHRHVHSVRRNNIVNSEQAEHIARLVQGNAALLVERTQLTEQLTLLSQGMMEMRQQMLALQNAQTAAATAETATTATATSEPASSGGIFAGMRAILGLGSPAPPPRPPQAPSAVPRAPQPAAEQAPPAATAMPLSTSAPPAAPTVSGTAGPVPASSMTADLSSALGLSATTSQAATSSSQGYFQSVPGLPSVLAPSAGVAQPGGGYGMLPMHSMMAQPPATHQVPGGPYVPGVAPFISGGFGGPPVGPGGAATPTMPPILGGGQAIPAAQASAIPVATSARMNEALGKEARQFLSQQSAEKEVGFFSGDAEHGIGAKPGLKALFFIDKLLVFANRFYTLYPMQSSGVTVPMFLQILMPRLLTREGQSTSSSSISSFCPARQWYDSLVRNNELCLQRLDMEKDVNGLILPNFYYAFWERFMQYNLTIVLEPELRAMDITHYVNNYAGYLQALEEKLQLLIRLGNRFDEYSLYTIVYGHFRNAGALFKDIYTRYNPVSYQQLIAALRREQELINLSANMHNLGQRRTPRHHHLSGSADTLPQLFHVNAEAPELNDNDNICVSCNVPNDSNAQFCVCEYVDSSDVVAMRDSSEFAHTLDAMYEILEEGQYFAIDPDSEQARQIVISSTCKHCGQKAHFTRDCPKLGGTGHSKLGAKFGTAKGFKEGDDPQDRPAAYRDARAKQVRRARAIAKRAGKSTLQSKKKGGKFATHARRMRTGLATAPKKPHYQAMLHALLLYGIAESMGHATPEEHNFTVMDAALDALPDGDDETESDSDL